MDKHGIPLENVQHLSPCQFVIPGFIDTHIHAPQYSFAGTAMDEGLLTWLDKYTFPIESRFADNQFAADVYTKAVARSLKNGTTTACYYATIHTESTEILCDIIAAAGQRAFVGKVNMDQNSPDNYRESTEDSIKQTKNFVQHVLDKKNPLITPVITPRFVVSCTCPLLKVLGDMAKEFDIPVQTHLSENRKEVKLVSEMFPEFRDYTDVYDKTGLLTTKTILAHCIYLSDKEIDIIKKRGSGISHCPNSNLMIQSGLLDVKRLLKAGVKVGLGTDVASGYSASILDAIRCSSQISSVHAINAEARGEDYQKLSYRECFRLATLGGSEVLGLQERIGNFEVGKEFDALVIDPEVKDSSVNLFGTDELEDYVQKYLFLGDDRNIKDIYVAGRKIDKKVLHC